MRRLLKAAVTFGLTALFTIFCATDYRIWRSLGPPDIKNGDLYSYEAKTVLRYPGDIYEVTIRVQTVQGVSMNQRFRINCPLKTLQNLDQQGPAQPIPQGTAAEKMWLLMKDHGPQL